MIQLSDIIEYIKEYVINVSHDVEDLVVKNISTLDSSLPECMGWIATYKKETQKLAEQSNVKYLITDTEVLITPKLFNKVIIHVSNPRLVFILIAERFFHPNYYKPIDIQKSIGKNAQISPSATIMNASIGNNCIIHSNVVIYDGVEIGDDVIIHAGTVIGHSGLGCERDQYGSLHKFPHYSNVIIGSKVDIGPNCQITKGTLSPTTIGDGTKIDGLCSIGHNTVIGKNNWIASSVTIAGSVKVGNECIIYASSNIKDQIRIGNNVIIGMGSLILQNIPDNQMWYGAPAKQIKQL